MNGLVPGRIVYYVLDDQDAQAINRRRTDSGSIAKRIKQQVVTLEHGTVPEWPLGAQAHIGNGVMAGDIYPAMVVRVWSEDGNVNLRVALDGNDTYWATSIGYGPNKIERSWHWMFEGQAGRYDATKPQPGQGG